MSAQHPLGAVIREWQQSDTTFLWQEAFWMIHELLNEKRESLFETYGTSDYPRYERLDDAISQAHRCAYAREDGIRGIAHGKAAGPGSSGGVGS